MRARIDSGVASTIIRVPEGVAARIRVENGLGDVRVDRERFPRSGGGYESPGYVDAVDAVDDGRLTMELGRDGDGVWRGRWLHHEMMPVLLIPAS